MPLQNYQARCHLSYPIVISTFTSTPPGAGGKRSLSTAQSTKIDLVCVVSNWHFNRDAQANPNEVKCKVGDIYVSLKFSSEKFAKKNGPKDKYNFDRLGGVQMSYGTFLSLIQDRGFTHGFLKSCQEQYEEAEKRAIIPDSTEYPSFETEEPSKQVGKKGKKPAKKLDDYDNDDNDDNDDYSNAEEEEEGGGNVYEEEDLEPPSRKKSKTTGGRGVKTSAGKK